MVKKCRNPPRKAHDLLDSITTAKVSQYEYADTHIVRERERQRERERERERALELRLSFCVSECSLIMMKVRGFSIVCVVNLGGLFPMLTAQTNRAEPYSGWPPLCRSRR